MFRAQRKGKSPSSGEKIDFNFSNFQALQVPKVCEKLLVSIISIKTGITVARSNKALVRNGNCQWSETLSESIWISQDGSSKELEEHLFKFVVSMGSARSGILGEATVNISHYYTSSSSRSSSLVSLPLQKCNYGTILQVTIQCLTPRTKLRVEGSKHSRSNKEAGDENYDDAGSRSNGSAALLDLSAKFPSRKDLAPTSLFEKIKIMETSYDSAEYCLEKEKFNKKSCINGIKHNNNSDWRNSSPQSKVEEEVSVSKSNSSFKLKITHHEQEQECSRSSPPVPRSTSVMNVVSSKNLWERAGDTIEELLEQAADNKISDLENKQISNSQTRSDLEKEYTTTLSVKEENIKNLESKLSERKETEKDQPREIRRWKMKVSEVEKECSELTNENLELICKLKEAKKVIQVRSETIEENHKLLEDCSLKVRELESQKVEQEDQISDFEKEKEELQEKMEILMSESNISSNCLDNLRDDLIVLSSSLDSQVSANKLLEQKAMKLDKANCEMELCLFETEEENVKLLERVSKLESQLRQVKDEHEITRLELEKSESEKSDLQNEVKNLQNVERLLLDTQEECECVKSEKQKLQESAENLIEECNTLQKSYEDMTKGNAELYDQYSCLVIELTSEIEKFQKEVEHLKEEITMLDEQKSKLTSEKSNLESSLKEVHSRTEMTENKIQNVHEESEFKIQNLKTELATIKQNYKKLKSDHEKKSKLLTSYRMREEQKRSMENNLELKLTVTEYERQQLIEEAANLKDEVLDYKQKLKKLKNEKCNLEASLHSVSNSFEELKAEKMSFFNKMSEFEDYKIQRDALEEKVLRLEGNLTAKNASHSHDADMKNEISRIKSANSQHQVKIQQLEGEKKECLKKIEDLQLLSAKSKTGVHETHSQNDTDYAAKIEKLEAELNEALNANIKYRVQLQKLTSKRRNSHPLIPGKSKVEGEVVTKELYERTRSSLETELKDLRDRYLEMSLKYAEVEAERGDLVMQLKTNNSARKQFQFLERQR
ncbi:hypothetical protein SSX86_009226 [Deinandra increscens subsp. villosa]|uniref:C2 NT-type domain-containing protein n=1 Tax=Deinandra increscens subsp. villosa TaxID=3103831 RepID=A0AAP0DCW5_9ASTR